MNPHDIASFEWPLTPESVVFELGGYEGRWAAEIARRYGSRLYVFEPQAWAFERCAAALADYPTAQIFNFGLGDRAGEFPMGDFETDGASFLKGPDVRVQGRGRLEEFGAFCESQGLREIDLLLLNVEGYEFVLVPYLVERDLMGRIRYFMAQFHELPGHNTSADTLFAQIEVSHRPLWDYGLKLRAWERSV